MIYIVISRMGEIINKTSFIVDGDPGGAFRLLRKESKLSDDECGVGIMYLVSHHY